MIRYKKTKKRGAKLMGLKLENVKKFYTDKTAVDGITFEMNKPRCIWAFRNKWSRKNNNN